MASQQYPPKFEKDLLYPREYNLENYPMPETLEGVTANWGNFALGQYFNIYFPPNPPGSGVPLLSYGKHYFIITFNPIPLPNFPRLKNGSKLLFEFKDAPDAQNNRRVIFSDLTPYKGISNYFIGYVWLKEDPLRTYDSLSGGIGTLNIVAQLETTDPNWSNKFNIRTTVPIEIDLGGTNPSLGTSPILFQTDSGSLATSFFISESRGTYDSVPEQSYVHISASKLQTYGGEVKDISVEYILSSSIVADNDNEYKPLQIHRLGNGEKTLYEPGVSSDTDKGVNPISEEWKVYLPPTTINRGPNSEGEYEKVKFKLTFANSANSTAQNLFASESKNYEVYYPSGSNDWIEFTGSSNITTGDNNLLSGQMFINGTTGGGIEMAGGSALIKSVGYKGFTSASAGSGSGFLIYSASVMSDITNDYSLGGVGLELVKDSSSFFRFRTSGSGFPKGELDIRTDSFFLGSNTQFVSGSSGNVEISSSGFHLKPTGDVVISGSIEATAGSIGGFTVNGNDLTGSNASIATSDPGSAGQKVIIDGKNSNIEFHQTAKGGSTPTAKIGHIQTISDGIDELKYYGLSVSHSAGKIKLTSDADATDINLSTGFYESQVPLLSKLRQKTGTAGIGARLNGAIVGIAHSINTNTTNAGILAGTVGISTGSIWKRRAGLFGVSAIEYSRMKTVANTLPEGDFGLGVFGDTYIAGKTELSGSLNVTGSVTLSGSNTSQDLEVSMSQINIDARRQGTTVYGSISLSDDYGSSNVVIIDGGAIAATSNIDTDANLTVVGNSKTSKTGSFGTPNFAPTINNDAFILTARGAISASGAIYGKTFESENFGGFIQSALTATDYFFPIGSNVLESLQGTGNVNPVSGFIQHAMCDTRILRIKFINFAVISSVQSVKLILYKYDGSGSPDVASNMTQVGSDVDLTLSTGTMADSTYQYQAPSDWSVSAGDMWTLAIKQTNAFGSAKSLWFGGGLILEQNWNNMVSS